MVEIQNFEKRDLIPLVHVDGLDDKHFSTLVSFKDKQTAVKKIRAMASICNGKLLWGNSESTFFQ